MDASDTYEMNMIYADDEEEDDEADNRKRETLSSVAQSSCSLFNVNEIKHNIKQLYTLINLATLSMSSSRICLTNNHFNDNINNNKLIRMSKLFMNLNDLFDFYLKEFHLSNKKSDALNSKEFVQYLIVKRINCLNDFFRLNKKKYLLLNSTTSGNGGSTGQLKASYTFFNEASLNTTSNIHQPLIYLDNYEKFEEFESDMQRKTLLKRNVPSHQPSELKLIFKSTDLTKKSIKHSVAILNSKIEVSKKADGEQFICFVYQLEKKKKSKSCNKYSSSSNKQQQSSKQKISSLKKIDYTNEQQFLGKANATSNTKKISKRSSSADQHLNSCKYRQAKLKQVDLMPSPLSSSSASSSSDDDDDDDEDDNVANDGLSERKKGPLNENELDKNIRKFKLSEKCLAINSFALTNNLEVNEKIFSLMPTCNKIIVTLYRLVQFNSNNETFFMKHPIKYECYYLKNACLKLKLATFTSPTSSNISSSQPKSELAQFKTLGDIKASQAQSSSTSVFKRIFNKSKSSTRVNQILQSENRNSNSFDTTNTSSFDLAISKNQLDYFTNPLNHINLHELNEWMRLWSSRPFYNSQVHRENENFMEIISIFLNNLEINYNTTRDLTNHYLMRLKVDSSNQNSKYVKLLNHYDQKDLLIYHSNLTLRNQSLNDLVQFGIEMGFDYNSNCKIKFELLRFSLENNSFRVCASNVLNLKRASLSKIKILPLIIMEELSDELKDVNLKLNISLNSHFYPTGKEAIELFEFNLVDNFSIISSSSKPIVISGDKEKEMLRLVERYLLNFSCDFVLLRKLLSFFSNLNMTNSSVGLNNRLQMLFKLYEAFVKLLVQIDEDKQISLKQILKDLNLTNPKCAQQTLIAIVKSLLELEICSTNGTSISSKSHISRYLIEATLKHFDKLIYILVDLAHSSSSLYELKYDLNDLLSKLTKKFSIKQKADLIYSNLNINFLNNLNDLYTGFELSNLICNKLLAVNTNLNQSDEENSSQKALSDILLRLINQRLFGLNMFTLNYQFRDSMVEFINSNYANQLSKTSGRMSHDQVNLVKNLLKFKYKFSRENLDALIKFALKPIIFSLADYYYKTNLDNKSYLVDCFLCLVELLELIQTSSQGQITYFYFDEHIMTINELRQIFQIVSTFFNGQLKNKNAKILILNKTNLFYELSNSINNSGFDKVWLNVNHVIIKFANYIQKFLLFYLINNDSRSESIASSSVSSPCDENHLIKSYFDMLLVFIEQPNQQPLNHTTKMKYTMLQCLISFWRSMNIKLKRCSDLNELLLTRLCNCLVKNMYFKAIVLQESHLIMLNPFVSNRQNSIWLFSFYNSLIKFLSDMFTANNSTLFDFDSFKDFFFVNLMSIFIRNDRKRRKNLLMSGQNDMEEFGTEADATFQNETTPCKIQAKIVLKMLQDILASNETLLFASKENCQAFNVMLTLCFDYLLLKDEYELESSVSIIEKLVLIFDMIKQIDKVNRSNENKLFNSNFKFYNDCKRKIKMYLLDDLYHMHKSEKNYLHMSCIRKEQADLLDWNFSTSIGNGLTKKSTESDLKEMLYLKSLKNLSLNTFMLNDNIDVSIANRAKPDPSILSNFFLKSDEKEILMSQKSINNTCINSHFMLVQFEICKELCEYYDKLEKSINKNSIINETKFIELASNAFMKMSVNSGKNTNQMIDQTATTTSVKANSHGNLYFRVGFFGATLKFGSIRNKYFLYKHNTNEMLSNIQNLILNKLSYVPTSDENQSSKLIHSVVALLHHNHEPDICLKENVDKCFLQICALNKMEKLKLIELIDEMMNDDDREAVDMKETLMSKKYEKTSYFYYFDRPFYMRNHTSLNIRSSSSGASNSADTCSTKESKNSTSSLNDEFSSSLDDDFVDSKSSTTTTRESTSSNSNSNDLSVENLWLERSVLILDESSGDSKYEHLSQFEEVKSTFRILLNPIRNAISDINEKTKELNTFISQFSVNNTNNNSSSNLNTIHSLQPLTMRLLGCLDARVNGGLIKYVRELLNNNDNHNLLDLTPTPNSKQLRKKKMLLDQLHESIREQLKTLESGLNIHDGVLKNIENLYYNGGSAKNSSNNEYFLEINSNNKMFSKNFEHFKHMSELNSHLIECLKLIENELNERWSKIS